MPKSKTAKPDARKTTGRTRQPDVTRRNILDAALVEFAAKGLSGARVDEIAARSGSNKRMIYEYFGNKDGLWLTVLERAYERMREEEHAIDVARMSPVEGMRYLMEFNFKFCSRNPEFIALLNAENLHKASFLKNSKKIRELYTPLLVVITDLLQRGQRDGVFRKNVDPVELYTTIAALGFFYFSNIHTLSTIFGRNLLSPKQQKTRLDHSIAVVLGYLRP
ncbi:MAG: TetR family transcriptional regulator [Ferrovibrio sp.]|uniref:TetR/AcrR family transcriptional regulator n=1 Tax=Ferrovibrio sp. TaxID=1917215 RepID=UPI002638A244|nr:TetR/AcrR family transcriptional regulator [Ferrovibrio sp.]MCW0234875.1 TetR family transcriptional regulator [Ferrovibrio sp.]